MGLRGTIIFVFGFLLHFLVKFEISVPIILWISLKWVILRAKLLKLNSWLIYPAFRNTLNFVNRLRIARVMATTTYSSSLIFRIRLKNNKIMKYFHSIDVITRIDIFSYKIVLVTFFKL